MKRIDLGNPHPRQIPLAFSEVTYRVEGYRYLDAPQPSAGPPLWDVIEARRSRIAVRPLNEHSLSVFLWMCAKVRHQRPTTDGCNVSHRPAPSAGGLHPIDMLVIDNPKHPTLAVYDANAHVLCDLRLADSTLLVALVDEVSSVIPSVAGSIVLFGGHFDRTLAKYNNGESLVWRDSGALLTLCYLVAEGLAIDCCGLGITGEPWLSRLVQHGSGMRGVGGCIVGQRSC